MRADAERVARDVLVERLLLDLDRVRRRRPALADLNVIASPVQNVRMVFDLMPTDTDDEVAVAGPPDGRRARRAGRVLAEPAARAAPTGEVVGGPAGRQVRRAVRHLLGDAGASTGFFTGLAAGEAGRQPRVR